MRMRLFVGAHRELGDMACDGAAGHIEADVPASGAALPGAHERQVHRIGHEIGLQQETDLLAFGGKIVRLPGKPVLEVMTVTENKTGVLIEIDNGGSIGYRNEPHRLLPGAVEVLVPAIERDSEDGSRLPLEGDA